MIRIAIWTAALLLLAPAGASAATLTNAGGTLVYAAAAGRTNQVVFDEGPSGTVQVQRLGPGLGGVDDDPISATGCIENTPGDDYTCAGVTLVRADGGDGDDILDGGGVNLSTTGLTAARAELTGGSGRDELDGGAAEDTLRGGAGDDTLSGFGAGDSLMAEGGDDTLQGGAGADVYSGGDGVDFAQFAVSADPPPAIRVTLDGVADDGPAGENDNVLEDVEDVTADSNNPTPGAADGAVTLTGSARANVLTVLAGAGTITGGAGNDTLTGGTGDDTIQARDGYADRVKCGAGADTAVVDTLDTVAEDCEAQSSADVGYATEDHAPTVSWVAPAAAALLSPSAPMTLTVSASDDRGVARVQFYAAGRLLCEDVSAPYSCPYTPQGGDVGATTLLAVAADGAGQTASALRVIGIDRFTPTALTVGVTPARDRTLPYVFTTRGRLALPPGITAALGCRAGVVSVQVKAGRRTISNRRSALRSDCTYRLQVLFRNRRRLGSAGRLKFTARFTGNHTLQGVTSDVRFVRVG